MIEEARENKTGTVLKCPYCGELLDSDSLRCPACGHEIRGRESVASVKDFFEQINRIEDEKEKADAIRSYVIPNNREDILEFMFTACANFDAEYYVNNNALEESISEAWYTQIQQCHKKANVLFDNPELIKKINKMYNEVQLSIFKYKNKHTIIRAAGIGLIIISIIVICLQPRNADGSSRPNAISYISLGALALGIILLVKFKKAKKSNQESNGKKTKR